MLDFLSIPSMSASQSERDLRGRAVCGRFWARILNSEARVVEWQTRTFEGRMPKGMRVQVPPRAILLSPRWEFAD